MRSAVKDPQATKQIGRLFLRQLVKQSWLRNSLQSFSKTGLLPPMLWKRLPVETEFDVAVTKDERFRYASTGRDAIGRALFWRGIHDWENETIGVFLQLAREARLFVDVGANTGVFSLLACTANPHLEAVAFEPVPRIFRRMQTNVAINNWQDRCELHNRAVSDVEGITRFHIPFSEVPTSASLHMDGFRGVGGELVEVEVTTLDVALSQKEHVDLVKIDVEGFEDRVMRGMKDVLEKHRPVLIFECILDGPAAEIEDLLHGFGYELFHLRPEGIVPLETLTPDTEGKYRNFLASVNGFPRGFL